MVHTISVSDNWRHSYLGYDKIELFGDVVSLLETLLIQQQYRPPGPTSTSMWLHSKLLKYIYYLSIALTSGTKTSFEGIKTLQSDSRQRKEVLGLEHDNLLIILGIWYVESWKTKQCISQDVGLARFGNNLQVEARQVQRPLCLATREIVCCAPVV
jgi:hypothetical protein